MGRCESTSPGKRLLDNQKATPLMNVDAAATIGEGKSPT